MKYTADCPNCFSHFSVNSEDIHLCHDGGFIGFMSKGYTFCPDCGCITFVWFNYY